MTIFSKKFPVIFAAIAMGASYSPLAQTYGGANASDGAGSTTNGGSKANGTISDNRGASGSPYTSSSSNIPI